MPESNLPHISIRNIFARAIRFVTHGSSLKTSRRLSMYLGIAFATLLVIWTPVTAFLLLVEPSYYSKWSLILPGGGAGHAVSLESVGQATATASSPYTSHSVDPKVNYKAIAASPQVLKDAANRAGLTKEEFGKPLISLVDQTAMIHFRMSGKTGQEAFNKAEALFGALYSELERLRNDEQERKELATNKMLSGFSEKLHLAQQNILEFQTHSRIVSPAQFAEVTLGLERSRTTLQEMMAEHDGLTTQLNSLKLALSSTPEMASAIIRLQTDPLFLELAEKHAKAASLLIENRAQWGENNFKVVTARDNYDSLKSALHARVKQVSADSNVDAEELFRLGSSGDRKLYSDLIEMHSREQGMARQIETLKQRIIEQQKMHESSTREASQLEDLKHKLQVATAVFTTALARIDLGKSDRFSTYPMVQMFSAPELPEKPDTLPRKLALAGAVLGSLFVLFGLLVLWIRKPFLQKILKNV